MEAERPTYGALQSIPYNPYTICIAHGEEKNRRVYAMDISGRGIRPEAQTSYATIYQTSAVIFYRRGPARVYGRYPPGAEFLAANDPYDDF